MSQEIRGGKNQFQRDVAARMPNLRAIALNLCRDTERAEDLVQDTVVRALENEHLFTPGTNLGGWLTSILKNRFINKQAAETRHKKSFQRNYLHDPITEDDPISKMELDRTFAAIKQLPKEYAQVIINTAMGYSYEEMAKETKIPVGTLKSRTFRGRQELQKILNDQKDATGTN